MGQSLGASVGGPSWRCWVVVMLLTSSSDWGALVFGCMMHCVGDGSFSDHAWRPGMCATGRRRSVHALSSARLHGPLHFHGNFNLNLNINFNFNQLPPQPACLELVALCFYASLFGSKMKHGYQSLITP